MMVEKGRSYLDFGNDVRPNYAGKSRGVKGAAFDFRSGPIILYSAPGPVSLAARCGFMTSVIRFFLRGICDLYGPVVFVMWAIWFLLVERFIR